jgi:CBS domain-containing protein
MNVCAAEIMTSPVHTVRPADPLRKVVALLCHHRISGVPVVDSRRRLLGLISERDVLEAMYPDRPELRQGRPDPRVPGRMREIGAIRAREIMVRDVVTATADTDVLRLASLMAVNKIRRIPIVESGRLLGIVSQGDVYRAIFERRGPARDRPAPPRPAERRSGRRT